MTGRQGLLFLTVAVLWGVPYALIKVALGGVEPLMVAWARVAIGAAVLVPIALRRDALAGLRAHAGALVLVAVCDIAAPFTLLTLGERHISSSLAGILVATTPLFVGCARPGTRSDGAPGPPRLAAGPRRGHPGRGDRWAGADPRRLVARPLNRHRPRRARWGATVRRGFSADRKPARKMPAWSHEPHDVEHLTEQGRRRNQVLR